MDKPNGRKLARALGALWVAMAVTFPAEAQVYKVLYSFAGTPDGASPVAGLIADPAGNLYGTTCSGGTGTSCGNYGCGTIFEISASGEESVLYSFAGGSDSQCPSAPLVRDGAGNLYGTTQGEGVASSEHGTVFELDATGKETILYSFTGGTDGSEPAAGLIRDSAGNLYGTTQFGGDFTCDFDSYGCGVVFKLTPSGKETVLHAFLGGSDGAGPYGGLTLGRDGVFYGVTPDGGAYGSGTVFRLTEAGPESIVYNFKNSTDGGYPFGPLISDSAGNLYGTTNEGGDLGCSPGQGYGCGTVFKIDSSGTETVLFAMTGESTGLFPFTPVVRDGKGNIYGTTYLGGDLSCPVDTINGCGLVFGINTAGHEIVLHRFAGGSDGAFPYAGLTRDAAGNLFGTTPFGGAYADGTVFQITRK
jgi:uncharacterized repeat protein (TIGR03803 family)